MPSSGAAALGAMHIPRRFSERLVTGLIPVALAMLAGCATTSHLSANVSEGLSVGAPVAGLANAVWADHDNDGYVDGYIRDGQYFAGEPRGFDRRLRRVARRARLGAVRDAPATAAPSRPVDAEPAPAYAAPPAYAAGPDYAESGGGASGAGESGGGRPRQPAGSGRPGFFAAIASFSLEGSLGAGAGRHDRAVRTWQTTNGALNRKALAAILEECVASGDGVGPDCADAVRDGTGNFSVVPQPARDEFVFLFQQSCPAQASAAACVEKIQVTNAFRSLPRGVLEPRPKSMNEVKKTLFTVFVRDSGEVWGLAARPTDVGVELQPGTAGQPQRVQVIPYSERMCFRLAVEDEKKALIEPRRRPDVTIEPGGVCMDVAAGGGGLKYDPSWWVTPLTGDDLELYLDTEYFVGKERRQFKYLPRPLVIDVVPKPGLWERIDNSIRRMTATVKLAIGLAEALGLLFTIIAGWSAWKWRTSIMTWLKGWRAPRKPGE